MIELKLVVKYTRQIVMVTKRPWIKKSTITTTWQEDSRRVYCNTREELLNLQKILRKDFGIHTIFEISQFPPENMGEREEICPRDIQKLFHIPTYHRHFGSLISKKPGVYMRVALDYLSDDWNVLMKVSDYFYILK